MEIVGNGLIANSFRKSKMVSDVVVFASGVSNSKELRESEYLRELDLIFEYLGRKIIYFSTCSIYDPTLQDSMYVQHKLRVERMLTDHGSLVVRLPQVVGHGGNGLTLANYLYDCIKNKHRFVLQVDAVRNLIDIEDVVNFVSTPALSNISGCVINLANPFSISVVDLVAIIENAVGISAVFDKISGGSFYDIPLHETERLIDDYKSYFEGSYYNRII
ncbi:MAG: hypothetical protein RLZZ479_1090, partial [Bacteroidota bacterium]